MALYKDYHIKGADVTVNTDGFTLVVHTGDAVWAMGSGGEYLKVHIGDDGHPVSSVSVPQKEGGRKVDQVRWNDRVTGK